MAKESEKKNFIGFIYCHKAPDGRCYVGRTFQKLDRRWRENGFGYRQIPFKEAIEQYGWDSFEHIVLEEVEASSKQEIDKILNKEERFWIKELKAFENGFNETTGGMNGRKYSDKAREKMSLAKKGKPGFFAGNHHTEEAKRIMSAKKKGNTYAPSRSVVKVATGEVYRSIAEAARQNGLSTSMVEGICKGRFKRRDFEFVKDN